MRFGLLISAIAALAFLGTSVETRAADGDGARTRAHHAKRYHRRYCCGHVGGYRYGEQHTPFTFNDANDYPGHYNNQNLWERVETQRNYPVGY
ncbi:MAG: hypothetical protein ACLPPF_16490 [Rhodomicrobium sp.]